MWQNQEANTAVHKSEVPARQETVQYVTNERKRFGFYSKYNRNYGGF